MLTATLTAIFVSCGMVLVLHTLRRSTDDDPDMRDFHSHLRSLARERTFGVAGR